MNEKVEEKKTEPRVETPIHIKESKLVESERASDIHESSEKEKKRQQNNPRKYT